MTLFGNKIANYIHKPHTFVSKIFQLSELESIIIVLNNCQQPHATWVEICLWYRIAGKFGGEKVWRIDSFRTFGERKLGELIDQPIGYQL